MDNKKDYVQGICLGMCPLEEIEMREREKLLHPLEVVPGTECSAVPKANRSFVVKSFSRSAAGKEVSNPEHLRPPQVLLQTISYLLFDVIYNETLPWHLIYDYITDRLMAVRQDMVIQNTSHAESIAILQPIIRFHAYAAFTLCNEKLSNFDPVINNNHLQECLKRLLYCYDNLNIFLCNSDNVGASASYDYLIESRPEFEGLYIIFNLGNEEPLRRALTLPQQYKTKIVKNAFDLSQCFRYGNFVKVCRLMKKLPFLLAAVASLFLPEIRRKAFGIMSTAYSSKYLKFPLLTLKNILLYDTVSELQQDCTHYGINIDEQFICFSKRDFNTTKSSVVPRHERFVKSKFKRENLYSILFKV